MSSARLVKLARKARRCCLAAVLALGIPAATLAATPGSSQQQAAVDACSVPTPPWWASKSAPRPVRARPRRWAASAAVPAW